VDSTDLLNAIKRAITVPQYQARFTDEDLLALSCEEQETLVVPLIICLREEYFVVRDEVEIPTGQSRVKVPVRALGRSLREVHYRLQNSSYYNLPRYAIEDAYPYISPHVNGSPSGFYIMGDAIYLAPTPNSDGVCALWYCLKPSSIVSTSRTGVVTSVTPTTVTLNQVPANLALGTFADITDGQPGYQLVFRDLTITNISGKTLTFDSDPVGVKVGDVVSTALETSLVQLPTEVQQVLVQAVCVRILQALAIPEQLQLAQNELKAKMKACSELMAPRVAGELPKIIQTNNLLRSSRSFYGSFPFGAP
jgi:hypothetical protein